jgi:hypothetical protein
MRAQRGRVRLPYRRSCRLRTRLEGCCSGNTSAVGRGNLRQGAAFRSQGSGATRPAYCPQRATCAACANFLLCGVGPGRATPLGRRGAAFGGLLRLPRSGPPVWSVEFAGLFTRLRPASFRSRERSVLGSGFAI